MGRKGVKAKAKFADKSYTVCIEYVERRKGESDEKYKHVMDVI